jgi:hypothetical protein
LGRWVNTKLDDIIILDCQSTCNRIIRVVWSGLLKCIKLSGNETAQSNTKNQNSSEQTNDSGKGSVRYIGGSNTAT